MTHNPLQQFFRQPKLSVTLPTKGVFTDLTIFNGDFHNIHVFGMTGMDELLLKTPDFLFSGDSTVKIIQSCCPVITNAWELTSYDVDALLVAIRIATRGNKYEIRHICPHCLSENEYETDLATILDYYNSCEYDDSINIDNLIVKIKPLTYKSRTTFAIENFNLIQNGRQIDNESNQEEKIKIMSKFNDDVANLQYKFIASSINSVTVDTTEVKDAENIEEWIKNVESSTVTKIKNLITKNNDIWNTPKQQVLCESCKEVSNIIIELDQSFFFDKA